MRWGLHNRNEFYSLVSKRFVLLNCRKVVSITYPAISIRPDMYRLMKQVIDPCTIEACWSHTSLISLSLKWTVCEQRNSAIWQCFLPWAPCYWWRWGLARMWAGRVTWEKTQRSSMTFPFLGRLQRVKCPNGWVEPTLGMVLPRW